MKVNITGRGIIPGLGVIPPIYNKEMSIPAISRLLNFPNFSVFDATTGIRFTKKNIKNVASTLNLVEDDKVVAFSSVTKKGRDEVLNIIKEALDEE